MDDSDMIVNRLLGAARALGLAALFATTAAPNAQGLPLAPPQDVLQFAATGTVEVQQDVLTISMTTSREGTDPVALQEELKKALDAALAIARPAAQPERMEVRTGQFGLWPRHVPDGRMNGWHGTAELVLEGRDFPLLTQTAARIQTLTVARVGYELSREQRAKAEREAQALAIERFKGKAGELARAFGFSDYGLREVAVHLNEQGFVPRRAPRAAASREAAGMPLPVEAGKTAVTVTVSGSVQLR